MLPTSVSEKKKFRRKIQLIFQDPYESLNPRQTVFEAIATPLTTHRLVTNQRELEEKILSILNDVGIKPTSTYMRRYPQKLSGGQRQRVVIASAITVNPRILIADEPVSMLDVSIRAEILNLFLQFMQEPYITILYITHDLSTAAYVTDRVGVMYLGEMVEIGPVDAVLNHPLHPYTRDLKSVIPVPNPRRRKKREVLQGETPNPIYLSSGCRFHPRCPIARDECQRELPTLEEMEPGHMVRCPYLND